MKTTFNQYTIDEASEATLYFFADDAAKKVIEDGTFNYYGCKEGMVNDDGFELYLDLYGFSEADKSEIIETTIEWATKRKIK